MEIYFLNWKRQLCLKRILVFLTYDQKCWVSVQRPFQEKHLVPFSIFSFKLTFFAPSPTMTKTFGFFLVLQSYFCAENHFVIFCYNSSLTYLFSDPQEITDKSARIGIISRHLPSERRTWYHFTGIWQFQTGTWWTTPIWNPYAVFFTSRKLSNWIHGGLHAIH